MLPPTHPRARIIVDLLRVVPGSVAVSLSDIARHLHTHGHPVSRSQVKRDLADLSTAGVVQRNGARWLVS